MAKDPACGRGDYDRHCEAGSSATFTYTMAIQASFANAAQFFNSLLVWVLAPAAKIAANWGK